MTLSVNQQLRFRAKSVEFRLPLAVERAATRLIPGLSTDPWLPAEKKLEVIFTHIPKSAGTSIVDALFGQKSRHIPVLRYAAFDEKRFADSFKFTFVRNPWSRIHSAYHYLNRVVGKGDKFVDWTRATHYLSDTPTFEDFILGLKDRRYRSAIKRYVHFRDQMDWISIPGRGNVMNFVGRFESLDADFEHVCEVLARQDLVLPQLRPGAGKDYRQAYTSQMVDIVADLYRRDIDSLGYEF